MYDIYIIELQVPMIKRTDTNKKAALLKASARLNISSGPEQFKSFYGRPTSRANGAASSLGIATVADDDDDEEE